MRFCEIWKEQCDAARQIEDEFGTQKALCYLIGEKFLNFLEAAETDAEFGAEIPAFVLPSRGESSLGQTDLSRSATRISEHIPKATIVLW